MLLLFIVGKLHKLKYLPVQVFLVIHPEMVIELRGTARYLRHFLKAEVICIQLFKRKHHMDEVFTKLRYPGDPLISITDPDHGFGSFYPYGTNCLKAFYKPLKEQQCLFGFTL